MSTRFEIQGHRGARGLFAENTLEGFEAAMAYRLDSIELDVAVTADGVPVVVHDPSLNQDLTRTPDGAWLSGPGPAIRNLSFAETRAYDVGRARPGSAVALAHPAQQVFDGARIPTLADVFQTTARFGVVIDVELKTDPERPELTVSPDAMADCVLACAAENAALSRLAVRSFDWRGLRHMRRVAPGVPLAWLTESTAQGPQTPADIAAEAQGCAYRPCWAPSHTTLTQTMIADAHALGLRVVPWTVNDLDDMQRLIEWGVDGICTDRPDLLRQLVP